MSVLQYVGARYVPKIYKNSTGGTEWESGVYYEPLTIVTYNFASYTSRLPVPAEIGNPFDNPEYWAATGNYNAQVAEYQRTVQELTESYKTTVKFYPTVSSIEDVNAGDIIITAGFRSAGDGGGCRYRVDDNDSGFSVQVGALWLTPMDTDNGINIKWLGAYCDANYFNSALNKWFSDSALTMLSHDDSALINRIISNLAPGKNVSTIHIPALTNVDSPINLKPGISISGIQASRYTGREWFTKISGFTTNAQLTSILNYAGSSAGGDGHGIRLTDLAFFGYSAATAITTTGAGEDSSVERCSFSNFSLAISVSSRSLSFIGSKLDFFQCDMCFRVPSGGGNYFLSDISVDYCNAVLHLPNGCNPDFIFAIDRGKFEYCSNVVKSEAKLTGGVVSLSSIICFNFDADYPADYVVRINSTAKSTGIVNMFGCIALTSQKIFKDDTYDIEYSSIPINLSIGGRYVQHAYSTN